VQSVFSAFVVPVDLAHIGGSLFPHAHEELPATIGNLQALEYLDVSEQKRWIGAGEEDYDDDDDENWEYTLSGTLQESNQ
jgi:hypothetical protein